MADHTETVDVDYDSEATDYQTLLDMFWKHHDPSVQRKRQYMSAIFYHDEEQKELAEASVTQAQRNLEKKVLTQILPAGEFYEAEGYHQKYMLQKHPGLLTSLNVEPDDLIGSHVCARLNGFLGGYGKEKDFDAEWANLGLNEKMAGFVRDQMLRNKR